MLSERVHIAKLTQYTTATATAPIPFSRAVDVSGYHKLDFIYSVGISGSTGTIYVEKLQNTSSSSSEGTIIGSATNGDYTYRALTGSATETGSTGYADLFGAITVGDTSGIAIATAGSNWMYDICVDLDSLDAGFNACRLYTLQAANNITFEVTAILSEPRYTGNVQATVMGDYTSL